MVFMNGSPDLLIATEDSDDEEYDGIPPVQSFHIMRHVHAQRELANPKPVLVLSHFHTDAYVSSTRTLAPGDIVQKINGIAVRDADHAEKLIRRLAANMFSPSGQKRVCISTPGKRVWLDLRKLLQEETLCFPEREPGKLHLLSACAAFENTAQPNPQRRSRRVSEHRAISALTIATAKAMQGTPPPAPSTSHAAQRAKRGRRSRPSSPLARAAKTAKRRSQRLASAH